MEKKADIQDLFFVFLLFFFFWSVDYF